MAEIIDGVKTITGPAVIDPTITGGTIDNTPIGGTTPAAGAFTQMKWAKGADVASANALVLGIDGNCFDITGTTSITSIGTLGIGTLICLHFDGILTFTHNATDLILPGGVNITTAAGDEAILIEYATGDWRCVNYSKASGKAVIGLSDIVEDTSPQLGGDLEYNEKRQVFKASLASDNMASGDIITVTFGEDVVFGKLCYPDPTEDEWMLALATNAAVKHPAKGVALETKANGESGKLLLRGLIRDATFFSGFALGDTLWLSDGTAGSWVNAAPGDAGDIVQIVGWALAANYAFFNPSSAYVEVA